MTLDRYFSILSVIPAAAIIYLLTTLNCDREYSRQNGIRQFLTTEHSLISIPEKSGNLYYHIEPYRSVRFTLKNGLTWKFAPYNSTICKNDTHMKMSFIDSYPENKENFDCYDNQTANTFNVNIICDPLIKYYVGDVTQRDECNYEVDLFTEAGCHWLYSDKYEL